jgi:exo-1,4-beta-D-glucosaminidase
MWTITSGLTQWKINSCWPSVQWQIFDWYLKPMVSYYAIKKACEPVHVQLCPIDSVVTVVNKSLEPKAGLDVRVRVFDFDMKLRWEKRAPLDVEANTYKDAFAVETIPDLTPVYFVKLELVDRDGKLVSDNFYWLSNRTPASFPELAELPPVTLDAEHAIDDRGSTRRLRAKVHNPTDRLAFFVHVAATAGPGGEEILPVFWDDNYFSLLPGETKEVTAEFAAADSRGKPPALEVGGWNVRSPFDCIRLEASKTDVAPDEPLVVTATIADTQLDGSLVELLVDGEPVDVKRFWARSGVRRELTFTLKLAKPGMHELRIGRRTVSVVCQPR